MVTETVFMRHAEGAKSWDATQMLFVCTVQIWRCPARENIGENNI